jgi:hypothetical protein
MSNHDPYSDSKLRADSPRLLAATEQLFWACSLFVTTFRDLLTPALVVNLILCFSAEGHEAMLIGTSAPEARLAQYCPCDATQESSMHRETVRSRIFPLRSIHHGR